jgi:DNA-binding transcriptional MerR regulator
MVLVCMPTLRQRKNLGLSKVGDVAKALGTTTRTLIYYEQEGLLNPKRTPKGTRLYSKYDIRRFEIALRLSAAGVPIKKIKELAHTRETCATGMEASQKVSPLLADLRSEIQNKIGELLAIERDLGRTDMLVKQCASCQNKPSHIGCPTCPMERNLDQSILAPLIWDPNANLG